MKTPGKSALTRSAASPQPESAERGRDLVSWLKAKCDPGVALDARAILSEYPELKADKSLVLDLAYEEYCQRVEAGEDVNPDEFCKNFPSFETSLRGVLSAVQWLEEQEGRRAGEGVAWPEPGQTFLGFILLEELGRGAFARVFLATEPALGDR
jgi:hypothetical protein